MAIVRGGTITTAEDGERVAEFAHFSLAADFRPFNVGDELARALFRWLHRRHRVTRITFVAPALKQPRQAFRSFMLSLGAEARETDRPDASGPSQYVWLVAQAYP